MGDMEGVWMFLGATTRLAPAGDPVSPIQKGFEITKP